jgi:nucleoside-diphosphate-sugar epimerase
VEGLELTVRILVTGHHGYIGCSLVPMLVDRGHDVVGLDSYLFAGCTLGPEPIQVPGIACDIRDVRPEMFEGFDAVVHLAALSNDPLGDIDSDLTMDINHRGTVRVAQAAKDAGVERFVFSSSCSLYGAHGDAPIDESAEFLPVTPYGQSKVQAERDLVDLADEGFSPVFLRNATAYGYSARLRGDLVVNNLVGYAVATGEIRMKSDGTPWRPLVHIDDIALAMVAAVEAPRDQVHLMAFNIGRTEENYRIREVATIVGEVVPDCRVTFADGAGPDKRNYRVSCDRAVAQLPGYEPTWTVRAGVEQVYDAYLRYGLDLDDLVGVKLSRLAHIRACLDDGALDRSLRWIPGRHPQIDDLDEGALRA